MSDTFYQAFEEKYRGSRAIIKLRMRVYEPFLRLISADSKKPSGLDLACGRGEWLEILSELGYDAKGIGKEKVLVEICRQRGLNVEIKKPIDALQTLASDSLDVITGFYIAEDTPFEELKTITKESFRVLKPNGILIFESFNPENIHTGAASFYRNPQHRQPVSPMLLEFLPEYFGFKKVKLIRLNENVDLSPDKLISLRVALGGVGEAYAVVAQKFVNSEIDIDKIQNTDSPDVEKLMSFYDQQINQQLMTLSKATADAMLVAKKAEDALQFIHQSFLWKATAPIRWLEHQTRMLRQYGVLARIKALLIKVITSVINRGFNFVSVRPRLHRLCLTAIRKVGLYERVRGFVKREEEVVIFPATREIEEEAYKDYYRLQCMSTESLDIYNSLISMIQNNGKLR
jgi:O-antigen chain-terminating methyltransferase